METGGTLVRHDNFGGHVIQRHVGKTDKELLARLDRESHILASSSFDDLATADKAIAEAIKVNKGKIDNWLSSGDRRLELSHNAGFVVGRVIPNGASISHKTNKVFVLIERDSLLPGGYRIHTAYPE